MPYNVEVHCVNAFHETDYFRSTSVPLKEELPELLRHDTHLLSYRGDSPIEYCVIRIQCSTPKRPPPIRVKRQKSIAKEETQPILMMISDETLANVENRLFRGSYYSYLMTHSLHGKKTSANIGYSRNPMLDVYMHNNLLIPDRTTNAAAPYWVLDMVLGPFAFKESAMRCCDEWVSGTRGKESKRKKAALLKIIYNVNLYDSANTINGTFRDFLSDHAHPSILEKYDTLFLKKKNEYQYT